MILQYWGQFIYYEIHIKLYNYKIKTYDTTRAKLVTKQRMGLPLMSKVKIELPLRSRVLKPKHISNLNKKKKSNDFWYDVTKSG